MKRYIKSNDNHDEWFDAFDVVKNPNTSAEVLDDYANHWSVQIRAKVADHPNTAPETLLKLISDRSGWVSSRASLNKKLTPELLTAFAESDDPKIRWQVANTSKTPKDTLEKLSQDKYKKIRDTAAKHLRFK